MLLKQGKRNFNLSKLIWAISSQGYVSATESRDPNQKPRELLRRELGEESHGIALDCLVCLVEDPRRKPESWALSSWETLMTLVKLNIKVRRPASPQGKIGHRFPLKTHQTSWQVRRNQPNLKWGPALGTPGTSSWGSSPRETSGPTSPQGKIGHRSPPLKLIKQVDK